MINVKATFAPQVHQSITVQNPLMTNLQNTAVIAESSQFVPVVSESRGVKRADPQHKANKTDLRPPHWL